MESHDEERIGYELKVNGNSSDPNYNIKTLPIAMRRMETLANLFYTVPGPKMLWQFGELGYDYSINTCENGTINSDCRLSPKPIRWDFLNDPYRRRLHDVITALLHLRNTQEVFETNIFSITPAAGKIREINLTGTNFFVKVIANVATTTEVTTPTWPQFGTWYEYYSADSVEVPDFGQPLTFSLAPGEYRIYTSQYVALPTGVNVSSTRQEKGQLAELSIFPNPSTGQVWIDFSLRELSDVQLVVTDATGRMMETRMLERSPAGFSQIQLSTESWTPGIYFVQLKDTAGGQLARRIVKL
jgi:hypothetical protein